MSAVRESLPLAIRAHTTFEPRSETKPVRSKRQRPRSGEGPARRPSTLLVFDCETTVDETQALLFGCYRFYRVSWKREGPELTCLCEGVFHPDDLASRDPQGFAQLARYARRVPAETDHAPDCVPRLRLYTRSEFVKDVLLEALAADATVVCFNVPFDSSRVAAGFGLARGRVFGGGFTFTPALYKDSEGVLRENRFLPRWRWRSYDSKAARTGLATINPASEAEVAARGRGRFLDARTLTYALSGDSHTLETACQAFGVDYRKPPAEHGQISPGQIDYCRADVAATAKLYQALATEYDRHGLLTPPSRLYSPAGLEKAYLREAGVRPILTRQPRFPAELLGYGMVAYYGGRADCRIRRVPVPVSSLDFASMYTTVSVLQGLWRFQVSRRVRTRELDPARLERWLSRLTLDDLFNPQLWRHLNMLVQVQPNGDVVPVRARYSPGGSFGIGVNHLTCSEPLWYTLADLIASTLLLGRPPKVLRAIRLNAEGTATGLQPLRIRRSRPIDPGSEDLLQAIVEERRRLERKADPNSLRTAATLKIVASSASYGSLAELNRQEPHGQRSRVDVCGLDHFAAFPAAVEEPGSYYFPPLAALVAGGARLMLALLERLVADAGGSYAFCDTDSMAVVTQRGGGLIPCPGGPHRDSNGHECVRALTWTQLDQIRRRFDTLNPYRRDLVPSILRLEDENYHPATGKRRQLLCFAISAKRYCLYTLDPTGEPELVKWSEHALGGFYLNPNNPDTSDRDWVREAWDWLLHTELGLPAEEPDWLDLPALSRFTASHPRLLQPFAALNKGKPFADKIKPANFLLVAHVASSGHPRGADPARFALLAPFEPDPKRWPDLNWRNPYRPTGPSYRHTTRTPLNDGGRPLPAGTVGVKSYRDVLTEYRYHPEAKGNGPDRQPCRRHTIGLLSHRHIQAASISHIGKEANLLEEITAGLVSAETDTLNAYDIRPVPQPRWCEACPTLLRGRQRRWCRACRANRRRRSQVACAPQALDDDPQTTGGERGLAAG